jgi:uracil phosphoribosyltransferase
MVKILGDNNSLFNQFLAEIRDEGIQIDRLRFRRNLERVGEIFAYEISKELEYKKEPISTPLGVANVPVLSDQPILGTILRAGLPLHQGLLNYFDKADNAFITAYRKYKKDGTFDIKVEYVSCPPTDDRVIIMTDPMLATGSSMVLACKALIEKGSPKHIYIVALIASKEGIEYIKKHLRTDNISIIVGAADDELTVKSYIVPGLGDAGDLAYGNKM